MRLSARRAVGQVACGGAESAVVGVVGGAGVADGLGGVLGQVAGDLLRGSGPGRGRRCGGWCGPGGRRAGGRRPGPVTGRRRRRRGRSAAPRRRRRGPGRPSASASIVVGAGANPSGVRGPSRRTRAWKWTTPRSWYSATLAYCTVATSASRVAGTPQGLGDQPAQGDGEPAPQVRCPPLPHQRARRSRSSRRTAAAPAPGRPRRGVARQVRGRPCSQVGSLPAWGWQRRPWSRRPWTGPNEGAVRVANTSGFSRHRLGHGLAAGDPGPDQLEHVRGVQPRAGRALAGAAVAAADVGDPEWLLLAAVGRHDLAGGGVDRLRAAAQPDRLGTVPDPGQRLGPGVEVPRRPAGRRPAARSAADSGGRSSGAASPNPGNASGASAGQGRGDVRRVRVLTGPTTPKGVPRG